MAFATATELGTRANMLRSLPASPNTTTSSSEMPSASARQSIPLALFQPARMTLVKPGSGKSKSSPSTAWLRPSTNALVSSSPGRLPSRAKNAFALVAGKSGRPSGPPSGAVLQALAYAGNTTARSSSLPATSVGTSPSKAMRPEPGMSLR